MSGGVVNYQLNLQTLMNGDKISAMCLAPSTFGFSYYWNNFFFGTSNGRVYFYSEGLGTPANPYVRRITVTGYSGTLSGTITGITADPTGKYLFVGSPTDLKLLRFKLSQFTSSGNTTLTVDSNIYSFGDNTGGIVSDTQGTVYFITRDGYQISYVNNYGAGYVNTLFRQPTTSNSYFEGTILSLDETRIYTADEYTGNIYYYDFTSGENTLQTIIACSPANNITSIASLTSINLFYNRSDSINQGVYLYDIETNTNILVAGGGSNTSTSIAQNYFLKNPNQIVVDPQGTLYISSIDASSNQLLTRVIFNPILRTSIRAPLQKPVAPNCGLPAPGNCKKVVIPFNPTTFWNLASPQRVAIKRPAFVGCNSLAQCYNTFVQLCPTIPPTRVNPSNDPRPVEPVAPIYPVETATSQYKGKFISSGYMISLRSPTIASNLVIPDTSPLRGPTFESPVFGTQGYIYFMTRSGTLNILNTSGGRQFPSLLKSIQQGSTVTNSVVVSSTGLVAFITDSGQLQILDQTGNLMYSYTLNGEVAGSPLFIDSQYTLVAAYGNTMVSYDITNGSNIWTTSIPNDKFTSSLSTDGVSVFAGTYGGNIASYSVVSGSNFWIYQTGKNVPIYDTPFTSGQLLSAFASNTVYIINKTPTRFGGGADTILTVSGLGLLESPPLLYTDNGGTTSLYFTTLSGYLYAAGAFLGVSGAYVDVCGGNIGSFWMSRESNILGNTTPIIDGNGNVYAVAQNYVYRYPTPPTSTRPSALIGNLNYYEIQSSYSIYASPIISSQNKLSFVAFTGTNNLVYTISS
jgi:hypothetical protein